MKLTVGTHEQGYVVVTDEAILSVISRTQMEVGAAVLGGALGGAIGAAITRKKETNNAAAAAANVPPRRLSELQEIWTCRVSELPPTVVGSAGWPRVEGFRSVTIYPKRIIQSVQASLWRGLVLTVKGQPMPMAVQMWQVGKMKKHLAAAGYRVA